MWDEGPDLLGAFVGSEGTLGIATQADAADPARARGGADAARRLRPHRRCGRRRVGGDRARDPAGGDRDDGRDHDRGRRGGRRRALPGRLRRGPDRRARRPGHPGRGGSRARRGDLPRERRARDPHRRRRRRPRGDLARAQGGVRRDGPRQPRLLRPGRRRAADEAARGPAPDRRSSRTSTACASATSSTPATATCTRSCSTTAASRARPARADGRREQILEACVDAGGSITGEHGVGTDKACAMPLMFGEDDLEAMRRLRARVRSARARQSGQGLPDAAALRRGSRSVPRASAGEGRPCRAVLSVARARARRPDLHRRGRRCGSSSCRPRSRSTGSASRSTRRATRRSGSACSTICRARCATASARCATS